MHAIKPLFFMTAAVLAVSFAPQTMAQKSGQSMQIQYGIVTGSNYVKEKSKAPIGALLGGAIGLYVGKGKSTGTKVATTALGAGLGAATTSAVQGDRNARQYHVSTSSGEIVIISDQTEIQVDDCVLVENPGTGNSNIRRVNPTYCDPASASVVAELSDEMHEDAADCVAAKKELSGAQDDAAVDRALRKISILCDS